MICGNSLEKERRMYMGVDGTVCEVISARKENKEKFIR